MQWEKPIPYRNEPLGIRATDTFSFNAINRVDVNEKLMATGSSMIFCTMLLDYPTVFSQLKRHYPADTPVAVVIDAGDRKNQKVIRRQWNDF